MEYKKKLIEVALPLEAINIESAREKSIRHGHPSTLHLWWARRPLAAARAVIWSSLVDDPSSNPDEFPTEEAQVRERNRLFKLLEEMVKWENINDSKILSAARAEILKSNNGEFPTLLDPFAGGGAIPLEAQRLGLEAHARDLNPVAVMINKAMIEIPPKFSGQPPVNPNLRMKGNNWSGSMGLADDVRYYGEWMKKEAIERIGHLFPKVKDSNGKEYTVISWIWARTIKCPNPACQCEMPLANSFELSTKKGKEAYIQPVIEGTKIRYEVKRGKGAPNPPKISRGKFKCICCGEPVLSEYIKAEGKAKRIGNELLAIIADSNNGRVYLSPNDEHKRIANCSEPEYLPEAILVGKAADQLPLYGFNTFSDLYTNRQLTALSTFSDLVSEAQEMVKKDGGTDDYAKAVGVYLAFSVDKLADTSSKCVSWNITRDGLRNTFSRQAIAMTWDYAEGNPLSESSGCFSNAITWIEKSILELPAVSSGYASQHDAQTDNGLRNVMVSTDPPYYDNICYADLSDYFYVWLRKTLGKTYPDLFRTIQVPKTEELIASHYRFDNNFNDAKEFFEDGMLQAFQRIFTYSLKDVPVTVYYAFKQSEDDTEGKTSSSGWETMLSAIIKAGFSITGTWPMRTEREVRTIASGSNALASSIVLVCRKREISAPVSTRRDFINILKRELKLALEKLQESNIAPVDLAQSAIGPGIAVYSRFSRVLEADGSPMSIRSALQIINQELDLFFTEQDGELDRDSRFCVDLYTQYAFNDVKFGEADVLARAKNTSVEKLEAHGILYAQKGVVRLLTREEIPEKIESRERNIWLLTQQITSALEKDGVSGAAKIVADIYTSEPEHAKALAYRLFQIAERKGWAGEAYAYNSLVIAWPDVQMKAAELQSQQRNAEQMSLFDIEDNR